MSYPQPPELPKPPNKTKWNSAETYDITQWKPTVAQPVPPQRCMQIKADGIQCKRFAMPGTGIGDSKGKPICKKHAPLPVVKEAADRRVQQARMRILGMSKDATKVVEELMLYATAENVRLAAANSILDRAGLKSAVEINVTVEHNLSPMDAINAKLAIIATHNKPEPAEDADIIDEGEITEEESDTKND